MHILEVSVARTVADAIKDEENEMAQRGAKQQRDQWIFEADTGTLQMSAETRRVLERA